MRKIIILITLLCTGFTAQAETNGRKVLDKAAAYIKNCGDMRVKFTATSFNGLEEQGSTSGTMLLQGMKFHVVTPEMITWFDGKTQWAYMPENEEVNVTEPTQKEMQAMNPYAFIGLYKKNYRTTMREASLRGESTYEIHLVARNAEMAAQEIYVDIRKSDYRLLCVRVRQDNIWNRISIQSLEANRNFSDADFTFPQDKYPNAEIIDLR